MKLNSLPLWPLALLCALIPFVATHTAWVVSMRLDFVPDCFPYLEGCTSISRSARHGIANHLFRFMMLPAAMLQIITWIVTWLWLRDLNQSSKAASSLPYLGVFAGIFLGLYVTFLGTEGDFYRLMRQYGVFLYFGFTYIAQLVCHRHLRVLKETKVTKFMFLLCLLLLPLGLLSVYFSYTLVDPAKDIAENIAEWNLAGLMVTWFILLSYLWYKLDLKLKVLAN